MEENQARDEGNVRQSSQLCGAIPENWRSTMTTMCHNNFTTFNNNSYNSTKLYNCICKEIGFETIFFVDTGSERSWGVNTYDVRNTSFPDCGLKVYMLFRA